MNRTTVAIPSPSVAQNPTNLRRSLNHSFSHRPYWLPLILIIFISIESAFWAFDGSEVPRIFIEDVIWEILVRAWPVFSSITASFVLLHVFVEEDLVGWVVVLKFGKVGRHVRDDIATSDHSVYVLDFGVHVFCQLLGTDSGRSIGVNFQLDSRVNSSQLKPADHRHGSSQTMSGHQDGGLGMCVD